MLILYILFKVCKYFGMEFIRGTFIVMKLLNFFINIPVYGYNLYHYLVG